MLRIFETYVLLFFIYSFLGWLWEVFLNIVKKKKFVNRGFLIGPYCPIYGYGVILVTILLKKYQDDVFLTYILAVLICGLLEYFTSYFMEKMFNARWWDYGYKKFNINGRICLDGLFFFGISACAIMYFTNPFFIGIISIFKEPFIHILVGCLLLGFIIDTITSFRIMFNLKDVSRALKDNTEEMSKKVRNILTNKSRLYKRLVYAFPDINAKVKLQEWKNRINETMKNTINETIQRIQNFSFPQSIRRKNAEGIKIKIKNIIIRKKEKYTRRK